MKSKEERIIVANAAWRELTELCNLYDQTPTVEDCGN